MPERDFQEPSLELMRPVENMDGVVPAFRSAMNNLVRGTPAQAVLRDVHFLHQSSISLITPEEMYDFHIAQGLPQEDGETVPITRGRIGELKGHLKRFLPDIFDEPIEIPTLPPSLSQVVEGTKGIVLVSVGAGPIPLDEPRVIQRQIHRYYEIDDSDDAIAKVWPVNEHNRRYPIAAISADSKRLVPALALFERAFAAAGSEVFPEKLMCGALKRERRGIKPTKINQL